ncbi:MAG: polysaccharide biosynthesis C-terminal domain-containing protein, partial [Oscillospiraceae bacterium]|nr:polysaccharide biosynthesis C-terminal domain-containing protein [Oscillospiraceae bacterium]
VMSVGALAMTAGMAGVRTATMYLTAEELGKKRANNISWVLSGSFLYSILCSGIIAGGVCLSAPYIARFWIGEPATVSAVRLYAGFLPVFCLCGVMTGYFTAANRIGTLALVEVAEQILSICITMLLLVLWAGNDPVRAARCLIFGSGLGGCMTLLCLVVLKAKERAPHGPRIAVRKRLCSAALPLALADDLKAGISTTENLMVPKRLALYGGVTTPLAAFGMVCGMVFPILMFPAAILFGLAELLIPELARCAAAGSRQRVEYLVKRSLKVALLYGCFFCGAEFLLSELLCLRLYKNTEAGHYLKLYALLIPMLYCDAITDAMTKGLGQQKACVRYNILTSSIDVALLFVLLPRYGMQGYYFSFLVTHLLNFILSLRRLLKISKCKISISAALLTLGACAGGIWSAGYLQTPFGKAVSFTAVFLCLLCLFGVVGKEDVSWIRGLIKKK